MLSMSMNKDSIIYGYWSSPIHMPGKFWTRSSTSDNVAVARLDGSLRNSKNPSLPSPPSTEVIFISLPSGRFITVHMCSGYREFTERKTGKSYLGGGPSINAE